MEFLKDFSALQIIALAGAGTFFLSILFIILKVIKIPVELWKIKINVPKGRDQNIYKIISKIYYSMKEIIILEKKKDHIEADILPMQMRKVDIIIGDLREKWVNLNEIIFLQKYKDFVTTQPDQEIIFKENGKEVGRKFIESKTLKLDLRTDIPWNFAVEVFEHVFDLVKNEIKICCKENGFYDMKEQPYLEYINEKVDLIIRKAVSDLYDRYKPPEWLKLPTREENIKIMRTDVVFDYIKDCFDTAKEIRMHSETEIKEIEQKIKFMDDEIKKELDNE